MSEPIKFDPLQRTRELEEQLKNTLRFVMDHAEEIQNLHGGTVGYKLELSADETAQLCKLIEQP